MGNIHPKKKIIAARSGGVASCNSQDPKSTKYKLQKILLITRELKGLLNLFGH